MSTELMDIGEHCSFCGQLDFLPFKCSCKETFCSQHWKPDVHNCPNKPLSSIKKDSRDDIKTDHLPPSASLFPNRKNIKIPLKTTETNPVTIKSKIEQTKNTSALYKLKKFFESSKLAASSKTKKQPKSNATKRIIELSQLKSSAKGDAKVSPSERVHIWVQVIDDESKFDKIEKHPIFISRAWPIGRAIDSISTTLALKNVNNKTTDSNQKLFLFKAKEGDEYEKISTSARCSTLKDGDTVYLVRGTEI